MEQKISELLDSLTTLRKESFGKSEPLYKLLGRAMATLIEAKAEIRKTENKV